MNSGDSIYIFNTLTEKIICLPISTISLNHQIIDTADKNILSVLQELGMAQEDNIDENRVYSFWAKRLAHDEHCFTVNVYLDNDINRVSDLLGIFFSDDSSEIKKNIRYLIQ